MTKDKCRETATSSSAKGWILKACVLANGTARLDHQRPLETAESSRLQFITAPFSGSVSWNGQSSSSAILADQVTQHGWARSWQNLSLRATPQLSAKRPTFGGWLTCRSIWR